MQELTTKEAAKRLGISIRQVQTLIQQQRLPAEKKGRDWFIKEVDLALVRERPKTGRPPKTTKHTQVKKKVNKRRGKK